MTPGLWTCLLGGVSILLVRSTFLERTSASPVLAFRRRARPQNLESFRAISLNVRVQNVSKPWCVAKNVTQRIRHRGCEAKELINKMCMGQCWSFYVPLRRRKVFESCAFCTPVETKVSKVVLKCPGKSPDVIVKNVKLITACACRVCGRSYIWSKGRHTTLNVTCNLWMPRNIWMKSSRRNLRIWSCDVVNK